MNEETKEQVVENDEVDGVERRFDELTADFMETNDWKKWDKESLAKELMLVENTFKNKILEKRKEFKSLTNEKERRENWVVRKSFESYITVIHSNYLCVLQGN